MTRLPADVLERAAQRYPGDKEKQAGYCRGWMSVDAARKAKQERRK